MELFIAAFFIGLLPAAIASGKGHSFITWWIYGAALFIIALLHALLLKRDQAAIEENQINNGMKKMQFKVFRQT
jgi:membrane protein implicated in regulation of membrane protease activity